ncbi:MAG: hypothetical protein ABI824_13420 [Acidobacteriota bacterium]
MQILAKKHGMSDVGLAKVCRKLFIPLPGRGYWAKRDAGHHLKKPELPVLSQKIVLEKPAPRVEQPKIADFASAQEITQIDHLERTVGEVPLRRGDLSHPLITQARAALKAAQTDDRTILVPRESCLDIRVSKEMIDRALHVMASLIGLIEAAGFNVSVHVDKRDKTVATIYGHSIRFGLVEKVERIEIAAPAKGGMLERVLTYGGKPVTFKASGHFALQVWSDWGSSRGSWSDRKSGRLEEQISLVVAGLMRLALADRAADQKRAAEERARQQAAEKREKLEELIQAEQSKVRALRHAATKWSRAEHLRSFISAARTVAVEHGESVETGSEFGDWLQWARDQADRLDPLKDSPASIIDRKPKSAPVYPTYYETPQGRANSLVSKAVLEQEVTCAKSGEQSADFGHLPPFHLPRGGDNRPLGVLWPSFAAGFLKHLRSFQNFARNPECSQNANKRSRTSSRADRKRRRNRPILGSFLPLFLLIYRR